MVFEAINGADIEEVIEENKTLVYRHGYFDSANPEIARLVTKTFKSLQKFSDDKIKWVLNQVSSADKIKWA